MAKPGILTRAKLAWNVFQGGMPRRTQLPAAMQEKRLPFLWPSFRRGQPQWHLVDFETYVRDGFSTNSLIYSAVMYKARAIASAPLKAYKGDISQPEPIDTSHPLAKLVARPNIHQSWSEFQQQAVAYLNISGNNYTYLEREQREGLPVAMYNIRPDRMFIVPDKSKKKAGVMGYLYVPENKPKRDAIPYLPQNIMHVKFPNPIDPLEGMGYGLSPMSALAWSADTDNEVTKFLKQFFERGLMTNVAIQFGDPISDADVARVRERWTEIYGGTEGWLKPAVLDSGASLERLGMSFDELGFKVIDERSEARILGPFGVPLTVLNTRIGMQGATYNNKKTDRRMCWEDTLLPEIRLFQVEFQYYLQGESGEFVAYDTSKIPALQEDITELTDAAFKMWQMGVPANQAFASVGLSGQLGDVPGGDIGYVNMGLLPAGSTPPEQESTQQGAAEAEEDDRADGSKSNIVPLQLKKKVG